MMRLSFVTLLATLTLAATTVKAQDGELLEYQQEIGGGIGMTGYFADAGNKLFSAPLGTLIWRRNFNPRMVVKTNLAVGRLSGNTKGQFVPTDPLSETPEGGTPAPDIHFGRTLLDLGAQFEFNFLGYGMGAAYKGLYRWTPYLLGGAGITMALSGGADATAGLNIPLGIGFRYKLRPRLNIGLEWSVNFTTSDRLDDSGAPTHLSGPYGIKSGMFKNKDCYTKTVLMLTYDISPKYRKCNN